MQNLLKELEELLKNDERLFAENKLLKNKIMELALKFDKDLLKLLLSDENMKKHFFVDVDKIKVFDKDKFIKFIGLKEFLPDSYTAFKNRIGLTIGDKYFYENNDVVLSWPHKDCVLEGGQTKEDTKRDEIFWNEILAPDETDRLLDTKVFTNFKKYDEKGEHPLCKGGQCPPIRFENENLIIKGNNLLALHSLKKRYTGKVKLIYIDPPYNTSTSANTFLYNNTFNHSLWLTFMKNRMESARTLLKEDGLFVTSIDHYELFYLGVLADEVFGRENRLGVISVVHNPGGRQDDKFFPTAHENILFYAKNIEFAKIYTLGISEDKIKEFKLSDEYGKYKLRGFRRSGNNSNRENGPGLYYPIYYNPDNNKCSLNKMNGFKELFPVDDNGVEKCWRWGKETFLRKFEKYIEVKKIGNKYDIYVKERECDYEGEKAKTIWNNNKYTGQTGTNSLKILFGNKVFTYPKSPILMKDILKITTKENDIIIDYHAGSGTTAHATLELNKEDGGNRKFIICEQMDYIETVTKERVKKVIEQNKEGSFVYCELMQLNEQFINRIQKAKTAKDLISLWQEMSSGKQGVATPCFLSLKVDVKSIDKNIRGQGAEAPCFHDLSLENQKKFLIECLDKNSLYVNYSEIEDKDYKVSEDDKKINKMFYEGE